MSNFGFNYTVSLISQHTTAQNLVCYYMLTYIHIPKDEQSHKKWGAESINIKMAAKDTDVWLPLES